MNGDLALVGGGDGTAVIYSISQRKIFSKLEVGSSTITYAIWARGRAVFATSTGLVKIFENGFEVSSFNAHAGEVTALAVHPSKEILASAGIDKSFILYDLATFTQAIQIYTDSSEPLMKDP